MISYSKYMQELARHSIQHFCTPTPPSSPLLRVSFHLFIDLGQAEAPLLGRYSESSSSLHKSAYDNLQKCLKQMNERW
jgi:hypothetical protein